MKLHSLKPNEGSRKDKYRVGRGMAQGRGKQAGRGLRGPPWPSPGSSCCVRSTSPHIHRPRGNPTYTSCATNLRHRDPSGVYRLSAAPSGLLPHGESNTRRPCKE